MNDFDFYLKRKAKEEDIQIPDSVKNQIEETLANLPEKETPGKRIRILPAVAAVAACFLFVTLFLFPNMSVSYAQALEKIPVIGDIVRVVTVRNYLYSDGMHEMNIDVPNIEAGNSEAAEQINQEIETLTKTLVEQFYNDLEYVGNQGHGAIYVDYETVTDTEQWFTLKIRVHEASGSSNTYYKYYHIDKTKGEIVKLSDIAANDEFYSTVEAEIKRQMKRRMEKDSNAVYWVDNEDFGQNFEKLEADCNFYWNKKGELVIVFDKYEVAPGSMGTPEFTIGRGVTDKVIKPEYKNIKG